MNQDKKISIIMGIYNCASTLEEAIESILAQTYTNWEFIICDDGSIDESYAIAEQYKALYPDKFVLLKNEHNMGLNYTLNRCLSVATGEYVARMDGDDVSLPERFEKEVDALDNHPEFAVVSTPMIFFDETGDWKIGTAIEYPIVKDFVHHSPFFCHAPCMVRREVFLEVGGYSEDKRTLRFEDCHLWYKIYAKGYKGFNLKEPLYKMRDDEQAYKRRTLKSRMNATYVRYVGFKMLNMPWYMYIYVAKSFFINLILGILPQKIYMYLHKNK